MVSSPVECWQCLNYPVEQCELRLLRKCVKRKLVIFISFPLQQKCVFVSVVFISRCEQLKARARSLDHILKQIPVDRNKKFVGKFIMRKC